MQQFLGLFAHRGFLLLNLANLLESICYFGWVPLLNPFLRTLCFLDDRQAGWVMAGYLGLVTLLMFPGGKVCDSLGARRSLLLALALEGAGRLLLLVSVGWGMGWVLLALTVMAAGTGIFQPTVYAGVKEYTRSDQAAAGYSWLYSLMNLGSILWFLGSPSIRAQGGIEGVYRVLTVLTLVNLLLQGWLHRPGLQNQPLHAGRLDRSMLTRPFLIFIWLLVPVKNLVAQLQFTLPTVVERVYPWFFNRLEYCYALHHLLLFLSTPCLTYLTTGRDLMFLLIGGSLVSSLSVVFLLLPAETAFLLSFVAIFSLGEAIWQSRFNELVARMAPPGKVGAAMSWANFPWFVAKTTAGIYSGYLLQQWVPAQGPQNPAMLWGCYLTLALLTPLSLTLLRGWLTQGSAWTETELPERES